MDSCHNSNPEDSRVVELAINTSVSARARVCVCDGNFEDLLYRMNIWCRYVHD